MDLKNFRFETDADGIALVTWDMPGRSMNVINAEVIDELGADRRRDHGRRRDQGRGRHLRQGALLRRRRPRPCCKAAGDEFARRAKAEGKEAAMRAFFDRSTPAVARSTASSKPAASRSPRRSTASAWAAASSWRSPATIASSPTATRRASACRRSRSACSPAPAARSASRG